MAEPAKCPKCGNQLDWCMICHACHPELPHADPEDTGYSEALIARGYKGDG